MERRDYLMIQVEQLGMVLKKLLSTILNLENSGPQAVEYVHQQFTAELGFDLDQLCAVGDERWIDTLQNDLNFDPVNLERLADLLLSIAENNLSRDGNDLCRKSLLIYEYLEKSQKTYSFERNQNIERAKKLI